MGCLRLSIRRSIATLAITTLLKTGSEGSVDRLMKQISSFMNEIADEFKIVVVKAIRQVRKLALADGRFWSCLLRCATREERPRSQDSSRLYVGVAATWPDFRLSVHRVVVKRRVPTRNFPCFCWPESLRATTERSRSCVVVGNLALASFDSALLLSVGLSLIRCVFMLAYSAVDGAPETKSRQGFLLMVLLSFSSQPLSFREPCARAFLRRASLSCFLPPARSRSLEGIHPR